jgi:hypothetical protein
VNKRGGGRHLLVVGDVAQVLTDVPTMPEGIDKLAGRDSGG